MKLTFLDRINNWARRSVSLKLLIIGVLILVLLIPASMISSLIYERQNLRDTVIREVSSKWGGNQTIAGPVISVPYTSVTVSADGKTTTSSSGYVHFLPDDLEISGTVKPQKRYRGIYVVVLYNAQLAVKGAFGPLNTKGINVPEEDLQWENALFTIGISDMKGVESAIKLQLDSTNYMFNPGTVTQNILVSGANVPISLDSESSGFQFSYELSLNGSTDLYFTPFGKETRVALQADWGNPSFEGAFLPDERNIAAEQFDAKWKVLQLNRNYPQQGKGAYIHNSNKNRDYNRTDYNLRSSTSAFGVKLLLPIDEYQKTTRSAKYATLFIFITFLTFFFIEVLNKKRLHPIQYLLVGAAVILFYVLLLSISEHLSFNWAYLIGCVIILTLITSYCHYIMKNSRLTWMVFGVLAILYGFFYSLLQLQDYALLLGSMGLLLILATIMYLTREVDWYDLKNEEE